jgi:uncharacterized protein YbbK (DUF523 family)
MKTVLASACCCGETCRWHGKKTYKSKILRELEQKGVKVIPVCPEMLGGLPCPRPPVRSIKGRVFVTDPETRTMVGKELTDIFTEGAKKALRIAKRYEVKTVYFFGRSPSCAPRGIAGKIFTNAGIKVIPIL